MKAFVLMGAALLASVALQGAAAMKGEVLEVQNVPNYTYLRLKTADGEVWAAVPAASIAKGAQVTLTDTSVMENFESRALKRKFDRIVFASLVNAAVASPDAPANPHGAPPSRAIAGTKVAKANAPDARTVAETIGSASTLKDKTVTIRGQVVKYSAAIMGKNWIHLQDGSGSSAKGTHDIVVTTTDAAAVGDVVDVRGTVRTNVDLGSGYTYAVLVEGAKVRK